MLGFGLGVLHTAGTDVPFGSKIHDIRSNSFVRSMQVRMRPVPFGCAIA